MDAEGSTHDIHDLLIQAESARARNRRRARERREAMTTEQRQILLSRRRNYYQRRRASLSSGQLQTIPLRPESNMPFNNASVQVNQFEQEALQTGATSCTVTTDTNIGVGGAGGTSFVTPLSYNPFSFHPNICFEGSTSASIPESPTTEVTTDTNIGVGGAVGTSFVTPLSYNPFSFHPNIRFQGSTSASIPHPPTTEDDAPRRADNENRNSGPNENHRNTGRTYHHHNVARNFREGPEFRPFKLPRRACCGYCKAKLFHFETETFCCNGGRIDLPAIPVPPELLRLFTDNSAEGKIFRKNIRAYNHIFSFTSMGVQLDESVTRGQGLYSFRAHRSIYHRIGTLLPSPGIRPRFLQMFIYDTDHEIENRLLESDGLNRELIDKIKRVLDACNPFVKTFRHLAQRPDLLQCKLVIKERPAVERQYVLPSESQVAAVISGTEEISGATNRDIIVQTIGGQLLNVNEFSGYYDPLQYPLFLPYGTYGWDTGTINFEDNRISCCDYYAYMLQIRVNNPSILLHGCRLLQQYVVDNYVKIETQKLRYIRTHQDKIRAELYQGLQDCLDAGENDARNIGRRTVLPSSFVGGPRDMYQRYQDAMTIVQKYGKPDIFLTMTCNPNWKEIQEQLLPGQTPQDRPDLMTRIFRAKYEELKKDIYSRGVLGTVAAHVHVVEFQKRGMPHVHMLVILHEDDKRLLESDGLNRELIDKIKRVLDACNPFVKTFRHLAQRPDLLQCKLVIKERPAVERQYVLPSESQVAAVISGTEEISGATNRDIIVQTIGGQLLNVNEFSGYYDPLQYPLFLPYGTYGWDTGTINFEDNRISCCDYYAYMLQIRVNNPSILLHGGRLPQQYVVDNYVKIETQKLRYIRTHQDKIRAELYQGLQDCLDAGENDARNIGQRTVLPSSFVGGPRDMYQRYQDAITIVQKYGKPDIFLTMTCNPNWKEIQEQLLPGQTPQDQPDLMTRIFRAKYEELKKDIYSRGVLGTVAAHVHVIEFQKRGMPHVHMLVILHEDDKLSTPDAYDDIVRAELPNKEEEPLLYEVVLRHMIHGPCGLMNPNSPCMKEGKCQKEYPKQFAPTTLRGNDSYPVYRRRDDNRQIALDRAGHKKGPDCVAFELRPEERNDEVRRYVDGRWICAPEALWKIYKFPISRIYPSVVRLQLHLPNMQQVQYHSQQRISDILNDERHSRTMLTEFFRVYNEGREVNKYLFTEFPRYYRWVAKGKKWQKRQSTQQVIGRLYAASPKEGERFYLHVLLNHVRGPKSFDDLLTVNGVPYLSFKQAAEKLGVLEEDDSIRQCLIEARQIRMPSALRRLFATILIFCEPTGVRTLWDENYSYMIEDYPSLGNTNRAFIQNRLLNDINNVLLQHKRSLKEFDLPQLTEDLFSTESISRLVDEELSVPISEDDLNAVSKLNAGQMEAFETIKEAILRKESAIFFVDGPGGTGKTFLYRALLAFFRNEGHIILATATSGIAATQLPGGRTAHSKLKIPFKLDSQSVCNFSKQSDMSRLFDLASAVIWDETPMANRNTIETLDRTFRDVLGVNLPFAGKVIVLGGDFRQVVPIVVGGTRLQTIQASIVESDLWQNVRLLQLTDNIRARHDQSFSDFLLRVGNGEEPIIQDDMIRIPDSMVIPWEGEQSIAQLISSVYPDLSSHTCDAEYMMTRALITPKNDDVNKLNAEVIQVFQGENETTYYSFDSVADDTNNMFLPEFLNSLSPGNLPPHKLTLKKGCPIMLLRNIDPKIGLCNGTRLICHKFGRHFIDAEVLNGDFKGTRVFLPRIPLKTAEDAKMPFELTRRQFPVRLSFALTINKSQGQSIPHVGIFLPDHVFSHGQLYVALSRGVSQATTKVLVKNGSLHGHEGVYTRNVVYPEIFARMHINQN